MSAQDEPSIPDLTESYKVAFETIKQLTTLNAGSIVVIGTFLTDIFPSENGRLNVGAGMKLLIALAFVSFGLSLVFSSYAMLHYSRRLRRLELWRTPSGRARIRGEQERTLDHLYGEFVLSTWPRLLIYVPFPTYTAGLVCFGLAVVLNLYR
jgi:hypothetical protein